MILFGFRIRRNPTTYGKVFWGLFIPLFSDRSWGLEEEEEQAMWLQALWGLRFSQDCLDFWIMSPDCEGQPFIGQSGPGVPAGCSWPLEVCGSDRERGFILDLVCHLRWMCCV